MNYDYFSRLEDGSLTRADNETEQAFMEKVLRGVFSEQSEELQERVNDKLNPQFAGCSAEGRSLSISFRVQEWMLNPNGTLHGGILTTAVDIGMSVLARYLAKKRVMVTAQLSMNFLRAIHPEDIFTVHVVADHTGRRSTVVHAWVSVSSSPKHAATATAVLM
jgi:uncharacterized protein (TIGR00369 family)